MTYETDRIKEVSPSNPSLSEMSLKALEILRQNQQGYFLMIEGGRIDHAYHAGNAFRALSETIALSKAVHAIQSARSEEEKEDTLILVTADHSHTFTIAGYSTRGNPILGLVVGNDDYGNSCLSVVFDLSVCVFLVDVSRKKTMCIPSFSVL